MKNFNKNDILKYCVKEKLYLTPTRMILIDLLSKHSKPKSAYELLKLINKKKNISLNISTIYRVLNFWIALGFVHKITALNKYILCVRPDEKHIHMLNFCVHCEKIIESCNKSVDLSLEKITKKLNLKFSNSRSLEIPVICSSCN